MSKVAANGIENYFNRSMADIPACCCTCADQVNYECTGNSNKPVKPNGMCPNYYPPPIAEVQSKA